MNNDYLALILMLLAILLFLVSFSMMNCASKIVRDIDERNKLIDNLLDKRFKLLNEKEKILNDSEKQK
ncbi:hypothetical protein BMR90_06930 [Leuconostoc mesenteroides subsp. cremoris]|uniref:hypothetical protein n=1 Tax=Leuconostoc mesenteroides TaxID=1245 RepID=UPI000A0123A2|nr:hypothetical protein [Leuconostoc mesenteroides]ORI36510.1 hypothetical protein BMR90_06930 [Leuconostoc mesenteroides subsp. cremoris]